MKKQIISCFPTQSSGNRNVLVEFLNNTANNIKWLNYAERKLRAQAKFSRIGGLEASDYVSEVKVTLLDIVTVTSSCLSGYRFLIIKNGKSLSMCRTELMNYFFALLHWSMCNALRREQKTISLPDWRDEDNPETYSDDDIVPPDDILENEFIIPFDDPFEEDLKYNSKEFIEQCCCILGDEDPLYRIVFEELLNGLHNREIAKKYKLSVRKIENIRKIINRRLNPPPK